MSASAQQTPAAAGQAPLSLERLEEAELPAVTITPPQNRSRITEERLPGGRRGEIRVQSGNSNYVVKPSAPYGSVQPGDAQSIGNRPAQWEILTFDPRRRAQQEAARATPVPPPPTMPPPAQK